MIPTIKENPRHHKRTTRGRKRFFHATIPALRMRVEQTFAWKEGIRLTRDSWVSVMYAET